MVRRRKQRDGQDGHHNTEGESLANHYFADQANKQPGEPDQSEPTNHREESLSSISTLTDPPSDFSQQNVFPENDTIRPTVSQPPLLYKYLDTNDVLNSEDTVHVTVYKSAIIASRTAASPQQIVRVAQPLIEEVEVYPHTTTAEFTIAWTDIAKAAPTGAGPSLHVRLQPLSLLAQALASGESLDVDSVSSGTGEYLLTSSSEDIDDESSGETVSSSEERRRDPDFSL